MSTITSHVVVATILAVSHTGHFRAPLAVAATKQTAPPTTGAIGLVLVIVLLAMLVSMAKAARGIAELMSGLMSGFLRVAASITSVLFGMLLVAVFAVVVLIHH